MTSSYSEGEEDSAAAGCSSSMMIQELEGEEDLGVDSEEVESAEVIIGIVNCAEHVFLGKRTVFD